MEKKSVHSRRTQSQLLETEFKKTPRELLKTWVSPLLPSEQIGLVKNCEGSEGLPYFHANKLACHSFIDTGRTHGSLLLTTRAVVGVTSFSGFTEPQFPHKRDRMLLAHYE